MAAGGCHRQREQGREAGSKPLPKIALISTGQEGPPGLSPGQAASLWPSSRGLGSADGLMAQATPALSGPRCRARLMGLFCV